MPVSTTTAETTGGSSSSSSSSSSSVTSGIKKAQDGALLGGSATHKSQSGKSPSTQINPAGQLVQSAAIAAPGSNRNIPAQQQPSRATFRANANTSTVLRVKCCVENVSID